VAPDPDELSIDALGETLDLGAWGRPGASGGVSIRPPGSKSLTNRAVLLAMLAPGVSTLRHALLDADDAVRMRDAAARLGVGVETPGAGTLVIRGSRGRLRVDPSRDTIDLNNAGTATRFLSAACMLADRPVTVTGNERMRRRPIGQLAQILRSLGCGVEHMERDGCVPIRITPPEALPEGAGVEVPRTESSQFVSALMLVAPVLPGGMTITMPQGVTSESYVRMTIRLLDTIGVRVRHSEDLRVVRIDEGLGAFDLEVEPDASGATYWWAAGALIPGGQVRVEGFARRDDPLQGDARFPGLLERMGCRVDETARGVACLGSDTPRALSCDMRDMPDAVMSLASVACFARGTSVIRGVRTLRVKECDRIRAMRLELAKIGVEIDEDHGGDEDTLAIIPPERGVDCSDSAPRVVLGTHDDHRMAMSLSLLALRRPNVVIDDPACVAKTYPNYWRDFASLYTSGRVRG